MLDDDEGHPGVVRHPLEQPLERFQATGRCADPGDPNRTVVGRSVIRQHRLRVGTGASLARSVLRLSPFRFRSFHDSPPRHRTTSTPEKDDNDPWAADRKPMRKLGGIWRPGLGCRLSSTAPHFGIVSRLSAAYRRFVADFDLDSAGQVSVSFPAMDFAAERTPVKHVSKRTSGKSATRRLGPRSTRTGRGSNPNAGVGREA